MLRIAQVDSVTGIVRSVWEGDALNQPVAPSGLTFVIIAPFFDTDGLRWNGSAWVEIP